MRTSFEKELLKNFEKLSKEQQDKAFAYIKLLLTHESRKQSWLALLTQHRLRK